MPFLSANRPFHFSRAAGMVAGGSRYRTFRQAMKAEWRAVSAPCALCGQQTIDYDAPPYTPDSFELDHRRPIATHPHLELEPTNAQPSHHKCNRAKGQGAMPLTLGVVSEAW